MDEFISKLNNYLLTDGVTLAKSVTIVLIGYLIIRVIITTLKKYVNRTKLVERTLPNFLISLLNIGLMAILVLYALTLAGVSPDSVVTVFSVFSLGLSLALQDTISSFANGVMIIVTKPFVEGEYVAVAGVEGTVVSISMFNTVLKTASGQMITVPNSHITTNSCTNYSRLPTRRLDMTIPVSYGSKPGDVKRVIMDVVKKQEGILDNPAPSVVLDSYGDSNLNYVLKLWVSNDIYWDTKFALNEQILTALTEANISIDYNQLDVTIKGLKNGGEK